MKIIKDNMEELLTKIEYTYKEEFEDEQTNTLLNYWMLFHEKEKEIQDLIKVSLETILYSKYYWCTQFKKRFNGLYGRDVGIEQQQYKIIEDMDQRIVTIDWSLLEMMTEGKDKEESS